jgi:hypothetical protein
MSNLDFIDNIQVNYPYSVKKWMATNLEHQLQCFCSKPFNKPSQMSTQVSCTACGFSADLTVLRECISRTAFPQWPKLQIPVCKICDKTKMTATKQRDSDYKKLNFVCACKPGKWMAVDDGNEGCWPGYYDVTIASNLVGGSKVGADGGKKEAIFIKADMF